MLTSKAFVLNLKDIATVGKTALLVGVAAALTYVGQNLAHIDLGSFGPLLVPVVTIVIDGILKFLKNNTPTTTK
jgi:hypothetical protein